MAEVICGGKFAHQKIRNAAPLIAQAGTKKQHAIWSAAGPKFADFKAHEISE